MSKANCPFRSSRKKVLIYVSWMIHWVYVYIVTNLASHNDNFLLRLLLTVLNAHLSLETKPLLWCYFMCWSWRLSLSDTKSDFVRVYAEERFELNKSINRRWYHQLHDQIFHKVSRDYGPQASWGWKGKSFLRLRDVISGTLYCSLQCR